MAYNTFIRGSSPALESHQKKNDSLEQLNLSLEEYFETADALIARASELNDIALENASNQILSNSDVKRIYRYADELGIQIQHQTALENHHDIPVTWNVAMEGIGDILSRIFTAVKNLIYHIINGFKLIFGFKKSSSSSGSNNIDIAKAVLNRQKEKLEEVKKMIRPEVSDSEKERIAERIETHFGVDWLKSLGSRQPLEVFVQNFEAIAKGYIEALNPIHAAMQIMANKYTSESSRKVSEEQYQKAHEQLKGKRIVIKYENLEYSTEAIDAFSICGDFTAVESIDISKLTNDYTAQIAKEANGLVALEKTFVKSGIMTVTSSGSDKITYRTSGPILGQVIETELYSDPSGIMISTVLTSAEKENGQSDVKIDYKGMIKFGSPDDYIDAINILTGIQKDLESRTESVYFKIIEEYDKLIKAIEATEQEVRRNKTASDAEYEFKITRTRLLLGSLRLNKKSLYYRFFHYIMESISLIKYIIPQKWEDVKK